MLTRTPGHTARGRPALLSEDQTGALVQETTRGRFRTYDEARVWVEEHDGVAYAYKGLYSLLHRLEVRPTVPRPTSEHATLPAQEAWTKGGSRAP